MTSSRLAAPVSESTARAHVGGDVSGQVAVGDYITQVGSVHGDLVLQNRRRPTVEPRPRPLVRLPSPFPDLLGRDAEVASTISRLGEGRSTCFYGVSGVGKSSVLRHVAHHPAVRSASDGVLHCAGRGQPLADLLQLVFDAFFDSEMGFTPTPGKVRHYLSSLRAVVVIDDLGVDDTEVGELADALPGCTFLVTSQDRREWEPARSVPLRGLPESAAMALLERHLERRLEPHEEESARTLSRALDGHPRRLVHAASATRDGGGSLADLAADVSGPAPEDATLRKAMVALTVRERDVLALIAAVEPAPLHIDRLAAITGAADVWVPLQALRDRDMVEAHSPRYSATVALPLEAQAARDRWRAAAIRHYLEVLVAGRTNPERFGEDIDAIRALVTWAVGERRWDDVIGLARGAAPVLAVCRRWAARDQLVRHALTAARRIGDRAAEAWCHHQLGTRLLWLGDPEGARQELRQALDMRRALGDRAGADVTQFHLDQLDGPPPGDEPATAPQPRPPADGAGVRSRAGAFVAVALMVLVVVAAATWRAQRHDGGPTRLVAIGATSVEVRPSDVSFASRLVGTTSSPQRVTLAVKGPRPFAARGALVRGNDFAVVADSCRGDFEVGKRCRISVSFTPSLPGERQSTLVIHSGDSQLEVALTGTGTAVPGSDVTTPTTTVDGSTSLPDDTTTSSNPIAPGSLTADPAELTFGRVRVGAVSNASRIMLRNAASGPVTLTSIAATGVAGVDFKVSDTCRSGPLVGGGRCEVTVLFAPTAPGSRMASLAVVAEGVQPLTVALRGEGIAPQLAVDPGSVSFGTTAVKATSGPRVVTVHNTGTADVTISLVSLSDSNPGAFTTKDDCVKATLKPGGRCEIRVYFQPPAPGSFSGSMTVKADTGPALTVALSGTAAADVDLTVAYCGQACNTLAFRARNLGPGDATNTRLTLNGVTSAEVPSGGTCSTTGAATVCFLGTIKAGATVDVVFSVSGSAVVKATLGADTSDPTTANNTDTVSVPG